MADIEPPSFSLDLDFDAEPGALNPPSCPSLLDEGEEANEDLGLQVMDSEEEDELTTPLVSGSGRAEPPQILKRLRRGPANEEPRTKQTTELGSVPSENADDDIEDFSSEDDDFVADLHPSRHYNSVCGSSKLSLRGSGVLTGQPSAQSVSKQKAKALDTPAPSSSVTGLSGFVFPKLTSSPLRKFQLIDSDEEPSPGRNRKPEKVKTIQCPATSEQSGKSTGNKATIEDLWKNFRPAQIAPIETPALDAFCNEYFQSVKNKNSVNQWGSDGCASSSLGNHSQDPNAAVECEQRWKVDDPLSPARNYFFHDDARIRSLVRNRLPHFFPVSMAKPRGNEQLSEPLVDYRSQFGGASKSGGTSGNNTGNGSTRGRKRPKKSDSASSQGWVDPKTTSSLPKDAGRRRVQASDQAAVGHWFTSPEGIKVYVAKNGQELTGRTAYRQFKRDSGGYRKSKKKITSKRRKT